MPDRDVSMGPDDTDTANLDRQLAHGLMLRVLELLDRSGDRTYAAAHLQHAIDTLELGGARWAPDLNEGEAAHGEP